MARPVEISLSSIIAALSLEAQSPGVVAKKLNVSRATLHRKLAFLTGQGLIVHAGQGRSSSYRLTSPRDELARAHSEHRPARPLRLDMRGNIAYLLRESLENLARLGIGQIEQIGQLLRWDAFGPEKRFTIEQIEGAEEKIKGLKSHLLGLQSNSSHGIYSPHVNPDIKTCWDLHRMIRHRLAWDRTPAGAMGVDFDEPMTGESISGALFTSRQDASGKARFDLEVSFEVAKLLIRSLRCQSRIVSGDIAVVVDLAAAGLVRNARGDLADEKIRSESLSMAQSIANVLNFDGEKKPSQAVLCDSVADAIEAVVNEGSKTKVFPASAGQEECDLYVSEGGFDLPMVSLKDLPEGHFLRHEKGEYKVIGPCEDPNYLSLVSRSHSAQTAIQMAINKFNKQGERAWTM